MISIAKIKWTSSGHRRKIYGVFLEGIEMKWERKIEDVKDCRGCPHSFHMKGHGYSVVTCKHEQVLAKNQRWPKDIYPWHEGFSKTPSWCPLGLGEPDEVRIEQPKREAPTHRFKAIPAGQENVIKYPGVSPYHTIYILAPIDEKKD
jgi:hypothetical protein